MSRVRLSGHSPRGVLPAVPSKSAAHRALICAALSGGVCRLSGFADSRDMTATVAALRALGAKFEFRVDEVRVDGADLFRSDAPATADCDESGSTVRFLIPLAAAGGKTATFTGRGRLPERPLDLYAELLPGHGVSVSDKRLPLTVSGRLRPGVYSLPGNVSSQFVSGLLMALPLTGGDCEIRLTTPLESAEYAEMTVAVMERFGVLVRKTETGWAVPAGARYRPRDFRIEGDWSQAAFFLAAGALGGDVTVTGLDPNSKQPDRRIEEILRRFGANPVWENGGLRVRQSALRGTSADMSQIPDLLPILAVLGACAEGETVLHSAARVRLKESDRIAACAENLRRAGIEVQESPDSLRIVGGRPRPAVLEGYNDHRIVMAFSILGTVTPGLAITDAEAVSKSYPNFFEDYNRTGGDARLVD